MKINLTSNITVKDVKRIFNDRFPYLKLEFFTEQYFKYKRSPRVQIVPDNTQLIKIAGVMKEGEMEITANQTVMDVEQKFQERFNLPVHILRRSRYDWQETTWAEGYNLAKQNLIGRVESNAIYDLQVLL
jgi:hypothetical protein